MTDRVLVLCPICLAIKINLLATGVHTCTSRCRYIHIGKRLNDCAIRRPVRTYTILKGFGTIYMYISQPGLKPRSCCLLPASHLLENMQRAEITGPNQPLKITESAIPGVPVSGYLIRTLYSGICHTDLHYIEDEVAMGGSKVWRHRDTLGRLLTYKIPSKHNIKYIC